MCLCSVFSPVFTRVWQVPATRPELFFTTLTRPELFFKISEFRVFPAGPFKSFNNYSQILLFSVLSFPHTNILFCPQACHYPYVDYILIGQFKQIGFQLWHLFHSFVLSSPVEQWRVGSITVYIFIASQIELKIETAVSQKLNFTPRGRLLNFPIQIWERESDQWDRKSVFQIDIDSVFSSSTKFWMKHFFSIKKVWLI